MAEEGGTGEGRGESRSQRLVLFAGSRIPQGCRSQVTPEYKQFLIIFSLLPRPRLLYACC